MRGVVGFSRSNSWVSRTICWFRKSRVSHTFIIINRGDRSIVMEAGKRQVQMTSYKKNYSKCYVELYRPLASDYMITKAIDAIIPELEKSYGYFQLLGFALVSLLKRFGIKIRNPIGRGIICSELVLKFLVALGFKEFKGFDKDTVAPDDLLRVVEKLTDRFERIQ